MYANFQIIFMKISFKKFIPGIAWFFIVLYLLCLPGSEIPTVGWLDKIYFDKWVHVGVFGLMVLLFSLPFNQSLLNDKLRINYFIKITIAAIVWGLTTELIQKYFVPGREFDFFDWAADSLGALIAGWFCSKKFIKASQS